MKNKNIETKRVAKLGLLLALTLVLSFIEYNLIPPLPIQGVKLGLSNIAVMYAIIYERAEDGIFLAVLKSLFVLLTRGAVSGLLSLSGGVFSVLAMLLTKKAFGKEKIPLISICGGTFHSIGQLISASVILKTYRVILYLSPIVTILGAVFGACTAVILKIVVPSIQKAKLH